MTFTYTIRYPDPEWVYYDCTIKRYAFPVYYYIVR